MSTISIPEPLDSKNGMKLAISEFQAKSNMTPTGEATEGLLMRLRKMDDLKPWGSIVYGPDERQMGNILGLRLATRGRCGGARQLRLQQSARWSSVSTARDAGPLRSPENHGR